MRLNKSIAERAVAEQGKAQIITATNVFAHIENIHDIVNGLLTLLNDDGIFISGIALLPLAPGNAPVRHHLP